MAVAYCASPGWMVGLREINAKPSNQVGSLWSFSWMQAVNVNVHEKASVIHGLTHHWGCHPP